MNTKTTQHISKAIYKQLHEQLKAKATQKQVKATQGILHLFNFSSNAHVREPIHWYENKLLM